MFLSNNVNVSICLIDLCLIVAGLEVVEICKT